MIVSGPGLRARFAFWAFATLALIGAGAPALAQSSQPDDSICLMIESAARDHGLPFGQSPVGRNEERQCTLDAAEG